NSLVQGGRVKSAITTAPPPHQVAIGSSYCRSTVLAIIIVFYFYLSHFVPLPFLGTSPLSQAINPRLPGTRLAFWSRGLDHDYQHSRTASTHVKQTQLTTLFTHVLTLSTLETAYYEEKTQHIGNRTLVLSTLMTTVGPV
ncbi:unnamed protein product, partial [Sphacelaria rigidula]